MARLFVGISGIVLLRTPPVTVEVEVAEQASEENLYNVMKPELAAMFAKLHYTNLGT